jgi:hypothetical protein
MFIDRSKMRLSNQPLPATQPLVCVLSCFARCCAVRRAGGADQGMSHLFETHPLVLAYMVPSLLSVYSDVEHTDRANQFYAKFNMRQYIGEQYQQA